MRNWRKTYHYRSLSWLFFWAFFFTSFFSYGCSVLW